MTDRSGTAASSTENVRSGLPGGTVAFLYTDIAGSTRLLDALGSEVYARVLKEHRRILRACFARWGGTEVDTQGDSFFVAFPRATDALQCALDAQLGLSGHDWPDGVSLSVRMAVHAGEALHEDGGYVGLEVHRGARIMAAGHGGQVLVSSTAAALVGDELPAGGGLKDLGEHELKDLPHAERLFQLTHPDLPATFPPLQGTRGRSNLPAQTSTFIGRDNELSEIAQLLGDPEIRLITLTGPGGTGKTRLALRVAEDHARGFDDGVYFVDLESASELNAALALIAAALGLTPLKGQSVIELLKNQLRSTRSLLLLDNFEQVTSAAPAIAELLEACPGLRVLVTSRQPLHLRGERLFPLHALGLPPPGSTIAEADLGGFEAIKLFVERARAVDPTFRMTDDNAAAIVEICRRVDGLPLAIELATARLKLFSPEALSERLGSRLALLRGGARDLPARQQTIHATIEWSYELLEPMEQRLFEVLSVFSDTAYEAIEGVMSKLDASPELEVDTLEGLASLLDKSLLRRISGEGEPRIGMLETIREYASEQLRLRPELEGQARRSHALFFADLVADPAAASSASDEIENLRAAWHYWIEQRDVAPLNQMAEGLWRTHEARGLYHATIEQATELLSVLSSSPASPERSAQLAALQVRRARTMLVVEGYTQEVEEAITASLESLQDDPSGERRFPVLRMLASLYGLRLEFDKASEVSRRILELAEAQDNGEMRAAAHVLFGAGGSFTGDLSSAADHLEKAISWYTAHPPTSESRRLGVHSAVAAHNASGLVLWLRGYPDQAVERSRRAIEVAEGTGDPYSVAYANYHTGYLYLWRREPDRVLVYAHAVLRAISQQEFVIWRALGNCLLGAANVGLGASEEGVAQLDGALEMYAGLRTPPIFWPLLRLMQAQAYARTGRSVQALEIVDEAMTLPAYSQFPPFTLMKGELLLAMEDAEARGEGERYLRAAYATAEAIGARMPQLQAAVALRRLGVARGTDDGLAELRSLYEAFTEGFETPDLVAAGELLAP